MASGTIPAVITKKQYQITCSNNPYVAPFTAFGAITDPYTDQATYGGIISLIPCDSSAVAGIDISQGRVMMSALSAGSKYIIVVFSKNAPAS